VVVLLLVLLRQLLLRWRCCSVERWCCACWAAAVARTLLRSDHLGAVSEQQRLE
jgi:hypothetical protein